MSTDVIRPQGETSDQQTSDQQTHRPAHAAQPAMPEEGATRAPARNVTVCGRQVIDRPASAVWEILGDYDRDPAWRSGVREMKLLDPPPVAVGHRTREVIRANGQTYTTVATVTALAPSRRLDFAAPDGPVPVHGHREVRPLGAGACEVTYELTFGLHGFMAAISPLLAASYRRRIRGDLARLAKLVTTSA